ncbi:MAG: [FeFe] hydrogenase, group A [Coriobacteriales bacterium]|jgi:iron-only hydrogenase group A
MPFGNSKHFPPFLRVPIEPDNCAVMRYSSMCDMCSRCAVVCKDYVDVLSRYDLEKTGDLAVCIYCGQCVTECSSLGMQEVRHFDKVVAERDSGDKILIASTSPSVRVSIGEAFGFPPGSFLQGKLVALLRKLGFDYVLDTNFAADLTVMEEAKELVDRIEGGGRLPQFTSCCPSWVRYCEMVHPDLIPNISTAKSPIGMQGPTIKTYFAKKLGIDPSSIVNVAITPCTAKKYEITLDSFGSAGEHLGIEGLRDMDYVVTAAELAKWARQENIDFESLDESEFDSIMGESSGAGVIFGATGGVMQAALREANKIMTGDYPENPIVEMVPVKGLKATKSAKAEIGGRELNVAVVYGTGNATKLIESMRDGGPSYDFIEVMTCPGGCVGGGGQPKGRHSRGLIPPSERIESLFDRDEAMNIRMSGENPQIKAVYDEFYGEPGSELAEQMLHTSYRDMSDELKL